MAMGTRRKVEQQQEFWIATAEIVQTPGSVFYARLNAILDENRFDERVEKRMARFYAKQMGRPSIAPGVYFRMLLLGYFEGLDSERGIAWRAADSLSLRAFLGYALNEKTPDHSTVSRTRRLVWIETHKAVFRWVIKILTKEGLVSGQSIAIDATTLEANASMKNIERRDTGQSYDDYLLGLASAAGMENPTKAELARMDRKRKKKVSNEEWKSPVDEDARIARMKDGTTQLAHKVEHAVDLGSGALVAITLQAADQGDTKTIGQTLEEAQEVAKTIHPDGVEEVVADKGYHSGAVLVNLNEDDVRSYIPEPDRGPRKWDGKDKADEQKQVYANRRRTRGDRSKRLQKLRSELAERSFAHLYETGGMRRVYLRGRENILKRLVIQGAAFNLSILLRKVLGFGKPRQFQGNARTAGSLAAHFGGFFALRTGVSRAWRLARGILRLKAHFRRISTSWLDQLGLGRSSPPIRVVRQKITFATGC
jgi:transposase